MLSRLFILWVKATQLRERLRYLPLASIPPSPTLPLADIVALVGGVLCRSRLLNKTFGVEETAIAREKKTRWFAEKLGRLCRFGKTEIP